jgi:hypothetical protein
MKKMALLSMLVVPEALQLLREEDSEIRASGGSRGYLMISQDRPGTPRMD